MQKLHQLYFYPNSKNRHTCIQLDFLTLVILSQRTNLINISSRFQLEKPYLLNEFLTQTEKQLENTSSFKIVVKIKHYHCIMSCIIFDNHENLF